MSLTIINKPGLIVPRRPGVKPRFGAKLIRGHPLARGLVGAWLMNEGGGQGVLDAVSSRHAETWYGTPTWAGGDRGPCLRLDGTDDGIDFGDIGLDLSVPFSIMARARHGAGTAGDNQQAVVMSDTAGGGGVEFVGVGIFSTSNTWKIFSNGETAGDSGVAVGTEWTTLMLTYDGSTLHLYLHGVLADSVTPSGFGWQTASRLLIGLDPAGSQDNWAGDVGAACAYQRELTAAEVAELHRDPYAMFAEPGAGTVFLLGQAGGASPISLSATPAEITASAPAASVVVPTVLSATAPEIAATAPAATLTAPIVLSATPGTISASAPAASVVVPTVLAATAPEITASAPTATLSVGTAGWSQIVDTFNRTDNVTLNGDTTSDGTETWTQQRTGFKVAGNQAESGGTLGNRGECHITSSRTTPVADVDVQVDLLSAYAGGVVIRSSTSGTSNSTDHVRAIAGNSGYTDLIRRVGGSDTTLLHISGTVTTVRLKAVGDVFYLYGDGSLLGTYDQSGDGANRITSGAFGIYSNANAPVELDNFSAYKKVAAITLSSTPGEITATAPAAALVIPTVLAATAPTIAASAPAATLALPIALAATPAEITASAPTAILGLPIALPATTPSISTSAPGASLVVPTVLSATSPEIVAMAPTATISAPAILPATAGEITLTAPSAGIVLPNALAATSASISTSAPGATLVLPLVFAATPAEITAIVGDAVLEITDQPSTLATVTIHVSGAPHTMKASSVVHEIRAGSVPIIITAHSEDV